MPPASDGEDSYTTVGCRLSKLVPDPNHQEKIMEAVHVTHKASILASELVNLHIRRMLDLNDPNIDLACCFSPNWLLNAYNEVTVATRAGGKFDAELRKTVETCMPAFDPPPRGATTQCLLYDARNLAAIASNNVWMHFTKRVLAHVRSKFAIPEEEYKALTKDERTARKLELMQIANDVCRIPANPCQSPAERHEWVADERSRLGIDAAVGGADRWDGKPILYHLKSRPHAFLKCMRVMSMELEADGRKSFALFPLRRSNVPCHARFDQKGLRDILGLGQSDHIKQKQKERYESKKRKRDDVDLETPAPKPERRTKEQMRDEQVELFAGIVDLRAAGVKRRDRFDFAFTTNGVCARVQMRVRTEKPKGKATGAKLASLPARGIWSIDQIKHLARRKSDVHVVGIDPGKRELVVGVDMDDSKGCTPVRYTLKQRQRDLRSAQYAIEGKAGKPQEVQASEASLAGFNSRSGNLSSFRAYCAQRHLGLEASLAFYSRIGHRNRKWKAYIKSQQSEERLYRQFEGIKKDSRPLVLAYGSWGMVAGRPGVACNKGTPPCIGVGLMRKLAKRFLVVPTPEAYTSKTCCKCLGSAGPWEEKEAETGRKIRGLRRCTQRDCMLPLNRDRNGATNIGANFQRLVADLPPIRSTTDADLAFHRAATCFECE